MASYSQLVQYNDFYPLSKYKNRVKSILYHFPFSNQYIANNKIVDSEFKNITFTIKTGKYCLKKYNYGIKFDIIELVEENPNYGYYSKHASDPAFIDTCDNGCDRCWERTLCYKCKNDFFLSGRKCLPIKNFFFRNPPFENTNEITIEYTDSDGVTIAFWTKPIGFQAQQQLMITLGNSPSLRLFFSTIENEPVYGLSLLGNGDTEDKNNIIGFEREFRDYIGKIITTLSVMARSIRPAMKKRLECRPAITTPTQ